MGEDLVLGHYRIGSVKMALEPLPPVDRVRRAAKHRDRGEVQSSGCGVGGLARNGDQRFAPRTTQGVGHRTRLQDGVWQVDHSHHCAKSDAQEHRNEPDARPPAQTLIGLLSNEDRIVFGVGHCVPTHSSVPS